MEGQCSFKNRPRSKSYADSHINSLISALIAGAKGTRGNKTRIHKYYAVHQNEPVFLFVCNIQ